MFVAALLDLRPELSGAMIAAVRESGVHEALRLEHSRYTDGVLTGSRFDVSTDEASSAARFPAAHSHSHHHHHHDHDHDHSHGHEGGDTHQASHSHGHVP
jgi:pyridinium-3,5-bisthiocarboxylic acid mononucleotide nickel chelatase